MRRLILLLALVFATTGFSQSNTITNDIIVMKDGKLLQAKVTKVTDDIISFTYPGESVVNEVRTSNIEKVVFASGRTQFFNGNSSNTVTIESPKAEPRTVPNADIYLLPDEEAPKTDMFTENSLSVLPIRFLVNDVYNEELSIAATDYTMELINNNKVESGITLQDMGTTVGKLLDTGISFNKLDKTSLEDAQRILGTEYILRIQVSKQTKMPFKKTGWAAMRSGNLSDNGNDYKVDIEVILFDANTKTKSYNATFSEGLSVKDKRQLNDSEAMWKTSLSYVIGQLLDNY